MDMTVFATAMKISWAICSRLYCLRTGLLISPFLT